jgi:nitrate/nitrite-specific signal transduction histidine kinase
VADRSFPAQLHLQIDRFVAQIVELRLQLISDTRIAAAETRNFVSRVVHLVLKTLKIRRSHRRLIYPETRLRGRGAAMGQAQHDPPPRRTSSSESQGCSFERTVHARVTPISDAMMTTVPEGECPR